MNKPLEFLPTNPSPNFDQLVSKIKESNPDFLKASTDSNARIECKVQSCDLLKSIEKIGTKLYLHLPLKVRVLSKGTKASLILSLGVSLELMEIPEKGITWCNYKFNDSKFENTVKSSNCNNVSENDLIDYFFTVVSCMQFYPFDEEIKALEDFAQLEQSNIKTAYMKFIETEKENAMISGIPIS
jgi:hypothetical protein